MALDWGIGRYEVTAAELEPAAQIVVAAAGVGRGERALDLGCGTGNAAIALARAGADVVAIDPSTRLLAVAQERAAAEGLAIESLPGEGAAIPLGDDSVDLIVSVFAVIFAPDPGAALAEMNRVLAPGGRILLTAWIPGYGIGKAYAAIGAAIAQATGASLPERFAWHDRKALNEIAEPLGLAISMDEHSIQFTAESPEAQIELDATTHPIWLDNLAQLEAAGLGKEVITEPVLLALREVNEDPAAFRTTSRYVLATLR